MTTHAEVAGPMRPMDARSDAALLAAVRRGDAASYGVLWERHRAAALRAGRALMPDHDSAEDLVQDAFHQVARAIANGDGPVEFFRAYLFTTMRHRAGRLRRRSRHEIVADDLADPAVEDADPVIADGDRQLVAAAFSRLPERLRRVLWHVDVERQPLAQVAIALDTSPNNVAALVGRARRQLRTLFIQAHLNRVNGSCDPECVLIRSSLGAYITGELSQRKATRVKEHLAGCAPCTRVHDSLADLGVPVRHAAAPARRA